MERCIWENVKGRKEEEKHCNQTIISKKLKNKDIKATVSINMSSNYELIFAMTFTFKNYFCFWVRGIWTCAALITECYICITCLIAAIYKFYSEFIAMNYVLIFWEFLFIQKEKPIFKVNIPITPSFFSLAQI